MNRKLVVILTALATGLLINLPTAGATPSSVIAPGSAVMETGVPVAHPEVTMWQAPVPPPLIVGRKFDPPDVRWHAGHRGVDICPGVGTVVRAPRAGLVIYAGPLAHTNVISVRHRDGLRTTFQPVTPLVSPRQWVAAGTALGTLEPGHEGNCLHWGVKMGRDTYLNPLVLLAGQPVLKPWDEPDA